MKGLEAAGNATVLRFPRPGFAPQGEFEAVCGRISPTARQFVSPASLL
jgi:hypothetical protein